MSIGESLQTEGEAVHLDITERMVVSPAAGVFVPEDVLSEGVGVAAGDVLGHVGPNEVCSFFTGVVGAVVAVAGERVTAGQPILWLRAGDVARPG